MSMRIFMALLGLLVATFTLATSAVVFRVFPFELTTSAIVNAQAFFARSDAHLLGGLLVVAALLTLSGLGVGALLPRKPRGFRYRISEGEVIVPQHLVEELAADSLRRFPGMVSAQVRASGNARGARLNIEITTRDGSAITPSTDELKDTVRKSVETQTGVRINDVRMRILLADPQGAPAAALGSARLRLGDGEKQPRVQPALSVHDDAVADPHQPEAEATTDVSSERESGRPLIRPVVSDPRKRSTATR